MSDTPRRISQFDLHECLYSGDRCDVFEASYTSEDGQPARAAVKVLRGPLACVGEELRLFLQEISWARKVSHRMFPRVIEAGESEGSYFLAMELIDGWTLSELLDTANQRGVALPSYVGLIIAHRLAVGSQELHEWVDADAMESQGLIHQGIEPDNVMVRRTGSVSLLDFGTIKSDSQEDDFPSAVLELTGEYHAPERLNGFSSTPQSDIFSLGRVLERMMGQMDPGALGEEGNALVDRACHPAPAARFTSMADFARGIEDLAEQRGLPLSKEVCANFTAIVFGSDVRRATTVVKAHPKKSFFHVGSAGMQTVVQMPPSIETPLPPLPPLSPVEQEEPILLSSTRASTEVDELDYEEIQTSSEDSGDWEHEDDSDREVTDVTGEVAIENIEDDDSGYEEVISSSLPESLNAELSAEQAVTSNVVPQTASGMYSDNDHQDATAFVPAEAMAAMASQGSRMPTEVQKRPKKKAFPQELIPTRAYVDSASLIRQLTKSDTDDGSGDDSDE